MTRSAAHSNDLARTDPKVAFYQITQATTATFTDLHFRLTFLFFIERGSKFVSTRSHGDVIGQEGDLMIFPPGCTVTMENRPVMQDSYRAFGVSFTHDLVSQVFPQTATALRPPEIQVVRANDHAPSELLTLVRDTLEQSDLPSAIRDHRLLEPLIWLRARGFEIPTQQQEDPISLLRRIVEVDLGHGWTAGEVAGQLAMSESTMRRWLAPTGQGFAKILLHTRLEHGLALLQTTGAQISTIALECGFKTPSHFSDAFRKRFGISPKDIRSTSD